jgi:signal transduction histidine kinase
VIRGLRWLRRHLGLFAELAGLGFWLLVDIVVGTSGHSPASVPIALIAVVIVLARRHPRVRVEVALGTGIAVSLLFSAYAAATKVDAVSGNVSDAQINGYSFVEQLALAILVVAVLRRAKLRTALLLTAAAAVAIVWAPVARFSEQAAFGSLSALGWGAAVAIGLAIREVETRRVAALEDVRTSERMELARELHDVVAHHVTGIVVAAQAAAVVARRSPEEVDRALSAIETAGTDALAAMRSMVGVLRGQDSEGARTPGAELAEVRTLVRQFDPDARMVRLTTDPGLEHAVLPAGVAATGYRVVQEALTNVRRHAPEATAVEVDIRVRDHALLLAVRSDGLRPMNTPRGTPRGGTGGFGLVGMAERVAALDGALSAGPTGPGVWTVAARLPLDQRQTLPRKGTG